MPYTGQVSNVVQRKILQTATLSSFTTVNAWAEPSSDYRITVNPHSSDNFFMIETYVPHNQTTGGANNIYLFRTIRSIGGGGFTNELTGYGQAAGSRERIAGGAARANNGYDLNDQNMESWITYDYPNTTSSVTYGFQMKQESSDSGTIRIAYTDSDNSTWGYTSRVIIVVTELAL